VSVGAAPGRTVTVSVTEVVPNDAPNCTVSACATAFVRPCTVSVDCRGRNDTAVGRLIVLLLLESVTSRVSGSADVFKRISQVSGDPPVKFAGVQPRYVGLTPATFNTAV